MNTVKQIIYVGLHYIISRYITSIIYIITIHPHTAQNAM